MSDNHPTPPAQAAPATPRQTAARPETLTRAECSALRGLAIIGIFLHNYCHWLGFAVKENEYTYTQHNVDWLWQVLSAPDDRLFIHLVSFFGHYGVPVFLFLSAFGLVRKYEGAPAQPPQAGTTDAAGPLRFMRFHYLKLFRMMIVGFVAFTMLDAITPGTHYYRTVDIVAQLLLLNNLLPEPDHVIWPGPYWFFGLMLQLYAVYRLLLHRRHWGWTVALMLVCTLAQLLMAPESEALNRYRYNFMGGMLPFGLGLLYARYGHRTAHLLERKTQALALALLLTGLLFFFSCDYLLWMWAPAVVCALSVAAVKALPRWLSGQLAWVGGISAALFVMHPLVRKVFIPISRHGSVYAGLLLYAIACICVAWLCRELMKKIPSPRP